MEIYKDGKSLLFQTDKENISSIITNILTICKDDVVKLSNYNNGYVVYIDNVDSKTEKGIIDIFKRLNLYTEEKTVSDIINVETNKEIFLPINMKNIKNKRSFTLYEMGELSGLSPRQAINKFGEKAFLQLYANYANFPEDERIFINDACRMYILNTFANTKSNYLNEEEIVHILYTYQEICKEQIESLLKESCYASLDSFVKESNITVLRAAYDAVKENLLLRMRY